MPSFGGGSTRFAERGGLVQLQASLHPPGITIRITLRITSAAGLTSCITPDPADRRRRLRDRRWRRSSCRGNRFCLSPSDPAARRPRSASGAGRARRHRRWPSRPSASTPPRPSRRRCCHWARRSCARCEWRCPWAHGSQKPHARAVPDSHRATPPAARPAPSRNKHQPPLVAPLVGSRGAGVGLQREVGAVELDPCARRLLRPPALVLIVERSVTPSGQGSEPPSPFQPGYNRLHAVARFAQKVSANRPEHGSFGSIFWVEIPPSFEIISDHLRPDSEQALRRRPTVAHVLPGAQQVCPSRSLNLVEPGWGKTGSERCFWPMICLTSFYSTLIDMTPFPPLALLHPLLQKHSYLLQHKQHDPIRRHRPAHLAAERPQLLLGPNVARRELLAFSQPELRPVRADLLRPSIQADLLKDEQQGFT